MAHPEDAALHHMRRILQDHGASWQGRLPDLTRPQFAALSVLAAHPGIDQVTLGARAAIDKSTLAGMLRRLEERRWVDRTPDRLDRRRQLLRLTAKGKAIVRAATPIADELDANTLASLNATEQRRLIALLTKLTDAITPTRPHAD
ncbi:MarR family winged helix-turn-helix transcriptional regulator [Nocardia sp. NPDC051756]|uniref:MarR family winged helix-turn-helix transcriptional regulator n=1 Tax=Nocardia sp. NPDC051756 TaxID=3154751 RepID=UPI0034416318